MFINYTRYLSVCKQESKYWHWYEEEYFEELEFILICTVKPLKKSRVHASSALINYQQE